MNQVKVGRVYRHFKGNYYYIQEIALDSETRERMVVYKALYEKDDTNGITTYIRSEKMFIEEIPERPDNITGQKYRFELVEEIEKNYL